MNRSKQVKPPVNFIRAAEHHWISRFDCDGHFKGLEVLQWNPGAELWSHSGQVGSGFYVDTEHCNYHSHCPMPD